MEASNLPLGLHWGFTIGGALGDEMGRPGAVRAKPPLLNFISLRAKDRIGSWFKAHRD